MSRLRIILKKYWVMICLFVLVLFGVFVADDWQQKRFQSVRDGYLYMAEGKYDLAKESFEDYLDVDSEVYWYLIEKSNSNFEEYTRTGVEEAIKKCEDVSAGESDNNIIILK